MQLNQLRRLQRPPDALRFVGAFGHREMELAAIAIVDNDWLDFDIDRDQLVASAKGDDLVGDGFDELLAHGWLEEAPRGRARCTPEFIEKCRKAALEDDRRVRERIPI